MAGTFERIEEIPEFQKDFRRLLKRYRTLREDLDTFISTQLKLLHKIARTRIGAGSSHSLNHLEGFKAPARRRSLVMVARDSLRRSSEMIEPRASESPEPYLVAGVGFEPATFGL